MCVVWSRKTRVVWSKTMCVVWSKTTRVMNRAWTTVPPTRNLFQRLKMSVNLDSHERVAHQATLHHFCQSSRVKQLFQSRQ